MKSKKKKSVRIDRIIILILIIILVVLVGAIAFKGITSLISNNSNNEVINEKEEKEDIKHSDNVTISINDYTVYVDSEEELGFNFIVASLTFKGESAPLVYDLYSMRTKQKIYLSQVDAYKTKLSSLGYDLDSQNIITEIRSDDTNTFTGKVFIPYDNLNNELTVYNGEALKFDLTKNNADAKTLKKSYDGPSQSIIENDDYLIYVSETYISDMMMHNGEDYDAGGVKIYTFKIHVDSIRGENIKIEDAEFVRNGEETIYTALDEEYYSRKIDNIIGKTLTNNMDAALFFEAGNISSKINYEGILRIKFSNNPNWIEIPTTIK